jgi:hypothetical protein
MDGWGDGLGHRAPLRLGAQLAWHGALGATNLHFVDFQGTVPLFTAYDERWSFGMQLNGGFTHLSVPGESRGALMSRSLSASLQFTFFGPQRLSFHGLGLMGGAPFDGPLYFWHDVNDVGGHGGLYYDGYLVSKWMDVSLRVEFTFHSESVIQSLAEVSLIVKPHARVALHAGVSGGFSPTLWGVLGVRGRPVDFLEVGLTGSIPLANLYGDQLRGQHVPLHPSLELRFVAPVRKRLASLQR